MKFIPQVLFLFIIWFTNLSNTTNVFTKVTSPNYELAFSKTESVKEGNTVIIKTDGTEIIKGNNQGISSFFPKNWNKNRILDEVEYTIVNNHGRDLTSTNPNEYFGFSRDGKVEIHFYNNPDGTIGSYFPKKR